ncbi:MAG: trans-aconitate 2-methyltransferase [Mycobacterium sp.]|jgi:trans-aconitate 2-methyltransferase|nr:trans-aconitate 2-methyltransferase [Mycobacterium sp.]
MTDWSGEDYATVSDLQRSMAADAARSLDLAGGEQVLDIGCGDGHVTRALAGRVPVGFVVGVDPAPGMLAEAAQHHRGGTSGPVFVRADVLHLPFTERFDVAVSFNALHWVPEQQQALTEIGSVLRSGARVLIQMVCAGRLPSVEAVAMTLCATPQWEARFTGFIAPFVHVDPATYGDLAAPAMLTLSRVEVTERQWDFGSRDRFAYWCSVGTAAWTDRLSIGERPRFVDELVKAYEVVAGRPGLFLFTQMRAELVKV